MKKIFLVLSFFMFFLVEKSYTNETAEDDNKNRLSIIEHKGVNYYINGKLLKKDSDFFNLFNSNNTANSYYSIALYYKQMALSFLSSGIILQSIGLTMIAIPISPIGMFMAQLMMLPVALTLFVSGILAALYPIVAVSLFGYALGYYSKIKKYSIEMYNNSIMEKKKTISELFINHFDFDLYCIRL